MMKNPIPNLILLLAILLSIFIVTNVKANTVRGTAFFINSSGYLLTAAHVVQGRSFTVVYKGYMHPVRVVAIDRLNDIAILSSGLRQTPSLSMGTQFKNGAITLAGYPGGRPQLKIVKGWGIVHGNKLTDEAYICPGNSGSPIINNKNKVVGIQSSVYSLRGCGNKGFGPSLNSINYLLSQYGIWSSSKSSRLSKDTVVLIYRD